MKRNDKISKYSVQDLQTLASALTERAILAARLGTQSYGGSRNTRQALGYLDTITYEDYKARYTRQEIAKAVIDRPVNATWQGVLELEESTTKEDTELEKKWKALTDKHKLKSKFSRLDKLAGLGQYAVLLFGFSDTKKLDDFVNPVTSKRLELKFVRPIGEDCAVIQSYVTDTKDERYGLPLFYDITFKDIQSGVINTARVHYSRVMHIVSEPLESEIFGTPGLEVIFDRLMDIEKIAGGDAEMFWRGARPGYSGELDKDYMLTEQMKKDLENQLDEYEHNLRRFLMLEGIGVKPLSPQVSDPANHLDIQIQLISAAKGIPKRILTGSERGQLASEQDTNEWKGIVQIRREEYAEQTIVRPFVDKLIEVGALPKPSTGEYNVKWADIYALSEAERVKIGKDRAEALKFYFANPILLDILPLQVFFELYNGFTPSQIDLIKSMSGDAMKLEQHSLNQPDLEDSQTVQLPRPGQVPIQQTKIKRKTA